MYEKLSVQIVLLLYYISHNGTRLNLTWAHFDFPHNFESQLATDHIEVRVILFTQLSVTFTLLMRLCVPSGKLCDHLNLKNNK